MNYCKNSSYEQVCSAKIKGERRAKDKEGRKRRAKERERQKTEKGEIEGQRTEKNKGQRKTKDIQEWRTMIP